MAPNKPTVVLLGTCDSKLDEILFLRRQILDEGTCNILLIDVGRSASTHESIDVTQTQLLAYRPPAPAQTETIDVSTLDRDQYVKRMTSHAISFLRGEMASSSIHAAIAVGGSSGTALTSAVMRDAFPIGFPKLIVSTMASGDVRCFVEETDIMMMYSVVDIAGLNSILKSVFANAAGAIVGMAKAFLTSSTAQASNSPSETPKRIGITMFGLTTPCVDAIREYLSSKCGYEVYAFHATGSGGRAMERLVQEGRLDGVIDMTTTEIVDELCGGVLGAGPDRLKAAGRASIPQIVSVGACDMVNFGPRPSVPGEFAGRNLHLHNPAITLMRTTKDDMTRVGQYIGKTLRENVVDQSRTVVCIPLGGISGLSVPGGPFHDREADKALSDAIENELRPTKIQIIYDEGSINDAGFALKVADKFAEMMRNGGGE